MAKNAVITRELYGPVIRLAVGLVILVIINAILRNVPMIQRLVIPGFPISVGAIISAIIGIIMIVFFLNFRREFAPHLQAAFPAFPEGTTIVNSAVSLGIIIIAYTTFDGLILPFMRGFSWVYSLVFLLIAIAPLYSLVITLYRGTGRITELLTGKMAEATGELVKCSKCGTPNAVRAKFCSSCGAELLPSPIEQAKATAIHCPKCGAGNNAGVRFCQNCGAALSVPQRKEP